MADVNPLDPRASSALQRLDEAVVPSLQRGARAAVGAASAPLRLVARAEENVAGDAVAWATRNPRLLVLVAAVLAVTASAVHLQRYPELAQAEADRRAAAADQSVSEPGQPTGRGDVLAGGAQIVGPPRGASVQQYVVERHAALAALAPNERRIAVVSFAEYLTAEEAVAVIPDGAELFVAQLRIPTVDERPFQAEVVEGDLQGSVTRALEAPIADFAEEEAALEELIPTVEDPAFKAEYEQRLEEVRAIRNLVNSGSGTVFSVVLEAKASVLQRLVDHELVRLVDVAPPETTPQRSGYFGLVPEDRDTVSYGIEP